YREHRVNPMAGCLPLLIQLPILFALYKALLGFNYLNPEHARFLWVPTLSGKDPYFILPVLAGASTYWQSRLTSSPTDPTQRMLLITMPVFIAWISTTVPAGLVLYWVVFSVVGALQQLWINRQIPQLKKGVARDEG
ncbi:MAG: membrane protein insertase YidC, partial [Thermoleophilia bacterium]|nr:membrane protein insertase YidC [Thermoleophilia bacterium]